MGGNDCAHLRGVPDHLRPLQGPDARDYVQHIQRKYQKIMEDIRVEPEALHITPASGLLQDKCGAQEAQEMGEGVEAIPDQDLAKPPPPDYPDDYPDDYPND